MKKPLDLSFQHKLEKQQKQINELTNWNKDLQEENLNLKMQLDLLNLKSKIVIMDRFHLKTSIWRKLIKEIM